MSRDVGIRILLPMTDFDKRKIYKKTEENCLENVYYRNLKESEWFRKLKIQSVYASSEDVAEYLCKKYRIVYPDLKYEDILNCSSISYYGYLARYNIGNSIVLEADGREMELLRKPHVNKEWCCRTFKSFNPDIYPTIMDKILDDDVPNFIDDELIEKTAKIINEENETDTVEELIQFLDNISDWSHYASGDFLILACMKTAKALAEKVGGIAEISYD